MGPTAPRDPVLVPIPLSASCLAPTSLQTRRTGAGWMPVFLPFVNFMCVSASAVPALTRLPPRVCARSAGTSVLSHAFGSYSLGLPRIPCCLIPQVPAHRRGGLPHSHCLPPCHVPLRPSLFLSCPDHPMEPHSGPFLCEAP